MTIQLCSCVTLRGLQLNEYSSWTQFNIWLSKGQFSVPNPAASGDQWHLNVCPYSSLGNGQPLTASPAKERGNCVYSCAHLFCDQTLKFFIQTSPLLSPEFCCYLQTYTCCILSDVRVQTPHRQSGSNSACLLQAKTTMWVSCKTRSTRNTSNKKSCGICMLQSHIN